MPEDKNYSKDQPAILPNDDADLATPYGDGDYANVVDDDDATANQDAVMGRYAIHLFKDKGTDRTNAITVSWIGKSNISCVEQPVFLQIYNRRVGAWETLASNRLVAANTKFTLSGVKSTNLGDYYDVDLWVSCRVYQHYFHGVLTIGKYSIS